MPLESKPRKKPRSKPRIYSWLLCFFASLALFLASSVFGQSALLDEANKASEENNFPKAEKLYHKLIGLNQNKAIVMFNLANLYYRNQDIPMAVIYYSRAAEEAPQFKNAYLNLGKLYYSLLEYARALQSFKAYLEVDPEDIDTLLLIGDTCQTLRDYLCALRHYELAYSLDSSHADVFTALSSLYLSFKDYDRALSYLSIEVTDTENAFTLSKMRARVLFEAGRYTEASASYIRAIEEAGLLIKENRIASDSSYQLSLKLAEVLQQDGLINVAIVVLKQLIEKFPDKISAYYHLEASMIEAAQEEEAFYFFRQFYKVNKNPVYAVMKNLLARAYNSESKFLLSDILAFYEDYDIQDEVYQLAKNSLE